MRTSFAVVAFFAFFSVTAIAQSNQPQQEMKDRYNWSGFYAGVDVGSSYNNFNAKTSTVYSSSGYLTSPDVDAINSLGPQYLNSNIFTGGGQVGYNFQKSKIVYGLEADFDSFLTGKPNANTGAAGCCNSTIQFNSWQNIDTDWLFMQRARVGYVFNKRTLIFATGGLAETDLTYASSFTMFNISGSGATYLASEGTYSSVDKLGWVGGAGVESALTRHLSIRPELIYLGIRPVTATGVLYSQGPGPGTPWPQNPFTNTANLHSEIYRLEINYKFNGLPFKKTHK